jgi:3-phosphoshikimate 1-carboxyvinyltransferase
MEAAFTKAGPLLGSIRVPGDKSISHRAAIVGALAGGLSTIHNYSTGADCASTLDVLRGLGVEIESGAGQLVVHGAGADGFGQPAGVLDCGNSGTTMRLIAGAVAPYGIDVTLSGDGSLMKRPMGRVIVPLTLMGAELSATDEEGHPPLRVKGGGLHGIEYSPPVASAQVKSAVLLAGLGAAGPTTVRELAPTRDHTERMLRRAGIDVMTDGLEVTLKPGVPKSIDIQVPGDFSSAAFFLAAALMCPGSRVTVTGVGLNPSRTFLLDMLKRMGASVETQSTPVDDATEPAGDITAEHGQLKALNVSPEDVAEAIDEITLVAMLATAAEGRTVITGARELRHKESDRIRSTVEGLRAMGALIEETPDGMAIEGPTALMGARVSSHGDHRIAMMLAVAGLAAHGETLVDGWEWTDISYPGFAGEIDRLRGGP